MRKFLAFTGLLLVAGFTFGAEVGLFEPTSWFASPDAVLAAAGLIVPFIAKAVTALGKDWFNTDGGATVWLSFGVAALIGGIGGYFALGHFAGVAGLTGAIQAVILVAVAFFGSNGLAKAERQAAASAAKKLKD